MSRNQTKSNASIGSFDYQTNEIVYDDTHKEVAKSKADDIELKPIDGTNDTERKVLVENDSFEKAEIVTVVSRTTNKRKVLYGGIIAVILLFVAVAVLTLLLGSKSEDVEITGTKAEEIE